MKLQTLLQDIPDCEVKGSQDLCITGISANSKLIAPGYLFIARKGRAYDGRHYIAEAIQAGARAIVTDQFDPFMTQALQVIHPHVAAIEGQLAASYYQCPSQELFMVGVTGTNGKTTISFIVKNLLNHLLGLCGLIGTIEYVIGKHHYPAIRTTPDVITNHQLLRDMVSEGCRSAVMEVTSHALDQGRVAKVGFDVAIFSNLTLDHLDYHQSMVNYGAAKKRLFSQLGKDTSKKKTTKWAIINQDSSWASYMIEECSANILSYGIDKPADLRASQICLEAHGTYAKITYRGQTVDCFWPLSGRFNVYNCLAAMAVGLSQDIPLDLIVNQMAKIPFVRGRLQPVNNCLGLKIYVDFAHSDDALLNVLEALKEMHKTKGRLIVVFGCGGDRDQSKRPKMAKVCERYADFCIVTADNPRSEDPQKICEEIVTGFTKSNIYQIEIDRKAAIRKAIDMAVPNDLILIAGKGHENYQIFAGKTIECDDHQVATDICAQK